jgi:two-component system, NtrC family, sensor kinase
VRIPRFSLTTIVFSAVSLLVVTTWVLLSIISVKTAQRDSIIQKKDEARRLVSGAQGLLLQGGVDALRPLAEGLAADPGFVSLTVMDAAGTAIFSTPADAAPDRRMAETLTKRTEGVFIYPEASSLAAYAPVSVGKDRRGVVRLTLSLQRENARVAEFHRAFLAYFILDFVLLLLLGALLLSRMVVTPVRRLVTATQRITTGDLAHRVPVAGSIEIAELARSFNMMVDALKGKREEVEHHVRSLEETNRDLLAAREETVRAEKMASVGLLAAGTAHEVGTPLAAIIGYSEILAEELKEDPDRRDYVRRLGDEARRIDRIIRGLLDFARPRAPVTEPVDLARLVRETVGILEGQGALKKVKVSFSGPGSIPRVKADPYQLQQVFSNLMINARDAMPDGGDLLVWVRAGSPADGADGATVSFTDSGAGIPEENLPRIFDPFFSTKEPGKGTGLGLAISARIVESFGGRIVAASTPGEGTTFTVFLPSGERGE